MTFIEALEEVSQGFVVSRRSWLPNVEGVYLFYDKTGGYPLPVWRSSRAITEEDADAEDWLSIGLLQ